MDRGAWRAKIHRIGQNRSDLAHMLSIIKEFSAVKTMQALCTHFGSADRALEEVSIQISYSTQP